MGSSPGTPLVIFVDRSIPVGAVNAVKAVPHPSIRFIYHDDIFPPPQKVSDHQWLQYAARHGYICVTRDKKLSKRRAILANVAGIKVRLYVFTRRDNLSTFGWLRELVNTAEEIAADAATRAPPAVIAIDRHRKLRQVYP